MPFEACDSTFNVGAQYKFLKFLGKGAYGSVVSVHDQSLNETVAIKKVNDMSKELLEAKQTLREVKILSVLASSAFASGQSNLVSLLRLQLDAERDDLYIFLSLMDTDLHKIIQSSQKLTDDHVRHFMFQILRGLHFLHSHSILHRDLKPANLLVSKDCHLRISDFGLSRAAPMTQIHPNQPNSRKSLSSNGSNSSGSKSNSFSIFPVLSFTKVLSGSGNSNNAVIDKTANKAQPLTRHVVTRWYRSPELMLNPDGFYSAAVDMWSVGCIFGELMCRRALFPGDNFIEQLRLIFDVIGTPKKNEMEYIKNKQAMKFLKSLEPQKAVNYHYLLKTSCATTVDIVSNLLSFDQNKRFTIEDCFSHDYFQGTVYEHEISALLKETEARKTELEVVAKELNAFETRIEKMTVEELRTTLKEEVDFFSNGYLWPWQRRSGSGSPLTDTTKPQSSPLMDGDFKYHMHSQLSSASQSINSHTKKDRLQHHASSASVTATTVSSTSGPVVRTTSFVGSKMTAASGATTNSSLCAMSVYNSPEKSMIRTREVLAQPAHQQGSQYQRTRYVYQPGKGLIKPTAVCYVKQGMSGVPVQRTWMQSYNNATSNAEGRGSSCQRLE